MADLLLQAGVAGRPTFKLKDLAKTLDVVPSGTGPVRLWVGVSLTTAMAKGFNFSLKASLVLDQAGLVRMTSSDGVFATTTKQAQGSGPVLVQISAKSAPNLSTVVSTIQRRESRVRIEFAAAGSTNFTLVREVRCQLYFVHDTPRTPWGYRRAFVDAVTGKLHDGPPADYPPKDASSVALKLAEEQCVSKALLDFAVSLSKKSSWSASMEQILTTLSINLWAEFEGVGARLRNPSIEGPPYDSMVVPTKNPVVVDHRWQILHSPAFKIAHLSFIPPFNSKENMWKIGVSLYPYVTWSYIPSKFLSFIQTKQTGNSANVNAADICSALMMCATALGLPAELVMIGGWGGFVPTLYGKPGGGVNMPLAYHFPLGEIDVAMSQPLGWNSPFGSLHSPKSLRWHAAVRLGTNYWEPSLRLNGVAASKSSVPAEPSKVTFKATNYYGQVALSLSATQLGYLDALIWPTGKVQIPILAAPMPGEILPV